LRQAEVELAQGRTVGEICRGLGVSEASFYRWRSEYGGLKVGSSAFPVLLVVVPGRNEHIGGSSLRECQEFRVWPVG
jgi:transposase-like protein